MAQIKTVFDLIQGFRLTGSEEEKSLSGIVESLTSGEAHMSGTPGGDYLFEFENLNGSVSLDLSVELTDNTDDHSVDIKVTMKVTAVDGPAALGTCRLIIGGHWRYANDAVWTESAEIGAQLRLELGIIPLAEGESLTLTAAGSSPVLSA